MPPEALIAPFLLLLAIAALCDLATMEIPNWVSIALALSFFPAAALSGESLVTMGAHLGVGLLAFLVCAVLFHFGVIGGGDAKVLAAASVWTGAAALAPFVFWTAAAGGVLALAVLAARRFAQPAPALPGFAQRLLDKSRGVPYAVAIAAGGLAAFPALPLISG